MVRLRAADHHLARQSDLHKSAKPNQFAATTEDFFNVIRTDKDIPVQAHRKF